MAKDEPRTAAEILAEIQSLDKALAQHEESYRLGHPVPEGSPTRKELYERRAQLLDELAQLKR
jgi:hypothetical protein